MLKTIFFCIILFILYLFHKYVLKPYLALQYYKKQGFKSVYFFPIFGFSKIIMSDTKKFNDCNYFRKKLLTDFPGTRGMATNFFEDPCLILTDTTLKKDFLINKHHLYEKHSKTTCFLKDDEFEKGAENLVLAEGEKWKRNRRIVSKIFNFEFIISNINVITNTTDRVFENIKDLEDVNLMNELQKITGNVILRSLLGDDFFEMKYNGLPAPIALATINSKVAGRTLELLSLFLGKRLLKFYDSGFKSDVETQKDFKLNFMKSYIEKKYEDYHKKLEKNPNYQPQNFLETNFNLVDKKEENLTLNEVSSNITILFTTGTDTTGHLLAHAIVYLSKHKHIYENLIKEIENIDPNIITANDYEKIKNLPYLNGVIKETLRLATPGIDVFVRKAIKDHDLGDLKIKKGTSVLLGISANFCDPSIFKNPFDFVPERWIKNHDLYDNAEEKDVYAYIPFSAGARNCIGQHLANIEARIILVKFLKRFSFNLKMKEPLIWTMKFVYEPAENIMASLKLR